MRLRIVHWSTLRYGVKPYLNSGWLAIDEGNKLFVKPTNTNENAGSNDDAV
jgi:hypothetical protein